MRLRTEFARSKIIALAVLCVAISPIRAQEDAPSTRREQQAMEEALPRGTRIDRDLAYGSAAGQKLDVYLPLHPQYAPILLMVHGGAWAMGDKSSPGVVVNKATRWLSKNYIFVSANYRLLPSAGPLEQADDIARALAYVQDNAKSWGGDPARIVLMGHSAGAHLVALVAADPAIAAKQGAKPWLATISLDSAAFDLVETMSHKHPPLYDTAFGADRSYWEKASPIAQLNAATRPMLLVCSTRRPDQPCIQARKFAQKDTSLGGKVEVLPMNLTHQQINETLGEPGTYTREMDVFLQSVGLP